MKGAAGQLGTSLATMPRYVQLATTLLNEIQTGKFPVGSLLPTEHVLCQQFGVSRFTVREAIKLLVQQGLVNRQPGVGTRVQAVAPTGQYTQTMSGLTDLQQYAVETMLEITHQEVIVLSREKSELLDTSAGETWLEIEGLRYAPGQPLPFAWTRVHIAPRFRALAGLTGKVDQPLYLLIEQQFGCRIQVVHQEIKAMSLDAELARLLKVPARSAGIWIQRRYMDSHDELVEQAVNIHPADRFTYRESFRREFGVMPAQVAGVKR